MPLFSFTTVTYGSLARPKPYTSVSLYLLYLFMSPIPGVEAIQTRGTRDGSGNLHSFRPSATYSRRQDENLSRRPVERVHPYLAVGAIAPSYRNNRRPTQRCSKVPKIAGSMRVQSLHPFGAFFDRTQVGPAKIQVRDERSPGGVRTTRKGGRKAGLSAVRGRSSLVRNLEALIPWVDALRRQVDDRLDHARKEEE